MAQERPIYTQGDFSRVQRYLDRAGISYLNSINGSTPESLVTTIQGLTPLKTHLQSPRVMVSVGVGQGEEVHALHELYRSDNPRIIGVDISSLAISAARDRASRNNLPVEFITASATDLPFGNESINGIVLSSVLHEVYSYLPHGKEAWNEAVQETARVLTEGGYVFVRDPATPDLKENVKITLSSDLAKDFYQYFRAEYRVLSSWDEVARGNMALKREPNAPDFPAPDAEGTIVVSMGQAADIMFHFRNFWNDYQKGLTSVGDPTWKEINEAYYLPSSEEGNHDYLSTGEYVTEFLSQANAALAETPYQLICVEQRQSQRPNMDDFLMSHFFLSQSIRRTHSQERSKRLIRQTTNKMQQVFQKVKK